MTPTLASHQKRQDLSNFIEQILKPDPAVQAVIGIGSLATGLARPDSDIDAVIFLEPFSWYVVPAEFIWRPSDRSYHGIFSQEAWVETQGIQFDFTRFDLAQWSSPDYEWPEGRRAELAEGWIAFDRTGAVASLVAERTAYTEEMRILRLDETIIWLDQHLGWNSPKARWDSLGPAIAHDRLQAAYDYLAQGLFAYNRRWRPWRNREMSYLLQLPWLPGQFADRVLTAVNAPSLDYTGYLTRFETLHDLFQKLLAQLIADGDYAEDAVSQAFIRSAEEPGRDWNMAEWNREHLKRLASMKSCL